MLKSVVNGKDRLRVPPGACFPLKLEKSTRSTPDNCHKSFLAGSPSPIILIRVAEHLHLSLRNAVAFREGVTINLCRVLYGIFSRTFKTFDNCCGLFASQSFWGDRRIRAPFAPPRISELLKVDALAQAVSTISLMLNSLCKIFDLTDSIS